MLASTPEEKPIAFQLFGADVATMAKAAYLLNTYKPDFIDINMGCPVKKVTKKGAGAALMATTDLAKNIILEVIKNSEAPVTVKFRKGIDSNNVNCIDFAKMSEDTGVAAITVHGRTWSQGFSGLSDWDIISQVKRSVAIPVIGNGDILSYEEAMYRLNASGCDGIMIGRGALGNPWIFNSDAPPENYSTIIKTVLRHLDLTQKYLEVDRLLAVIKNHIGRYFKNKKGSASFRKQVYNSKSFDDLYSGLQNLAVIAAESEKNV